MKIGLYNEPFGGGLGGAELCVGVLAAALAGKDDVEIVHHRQGLTREALSAHCGEDLSRVGLRCVPHDAGWMSHARSPWRHYREVSQWHAGLSSPYDLFVDFTHGIPPFCHARRGALVVLFPAQPRAEGDGGETLMGRLNRMRRDWEWKARMRGYSVKTSISRYTQEWTERWWDIPTQVLSPPVDTSFGIREKAPLILSVGRFTGSGLSKRQREMAETFRSMPDLTGRGWRYACAGGLSEQPLEQAYHASVVAAADGASTEIIANIGRPELRALYERASIFWHAAGYGDDLTASPGLAEHFGIVTVEAMAAGCVPVVINKGGQPEIVEHGVSGFLWDTLDELQSYTRRLANDDALRVRMAEAARARAQEFTREQYVARFRDVLGLTP